MPSLPAAFFACGAPGVVLLPGLPSWQCTASYYHRKMAADPAFRDKVRCKTAKFQNLVRQARQPGTGIMPLPYATTTAARPWLASVNAGGDFHGLLQAQGIACPAADARGGDHHTRLVPSPEDSTP